MANTNEVEQLNLQVGMDGANAQETLKLILGSLSGIQNKLLAIGKTPINIRVPANIGEKIEKMERQRN